MWVNAAAGPPAANSDADGPPISIVKGFMVAEGRSLARRRLRPRRPLIGRLLKVFQSRNVSISARLSTPAANQLPPCPPSSSSPPSGFFPFLLVSPSSSATWSFQDAIRMLSGCYQDAIRMLCSWPLIYGPPLPPPPPPPPAPFPGFFQDASEMPFKMLFRILLGWWIFEGGGLMRREPFPAFPRILEGSCGILEGFLRDS